MRILFTCLAMSLLFSCNSSRSKPLVASATDQQKQIDSLIQIIDQKNDTEKKKKMDDARRRALAAERNNLFKLVTTDKPAFDAVSFGGFRNISFHLFNDYNYSLEQVILKVHYLKANGRIIKTEPIILTNIAARSRQDVSAPDYTAAGTYLRVTVESALCKAINLCYYEGQNVEMTDTDPFKCK